MADTNYDAAMAGAIFELSELKAQREAIEARELEIRFSLKAALMAGDKEFKSNIGKAAITGGASKVELVNPALVPEAYWKKSIDTTAIGKVFKAGGIVPGVTYVEGEPILRVTFTGVAPAPEAEKVRVKDTIGERAARTVKRAEWDR